MWVVDSSPNLIEQFFMNALKAGRIPRHVAIHMDGNRRYAAKNNLDIFEGERRGYVRFTQVMRWCRDLNIRELTVYGISIENLKRTPEEVSYLMTLIKEAIRDVHGDIEKIREIGMCVKFFGNFALLSEDLRRMIAEAMILTEDYNKFFVNIAVTYSSRDELATIAKCMIKSVKSNQIHPDDINERLVSNCLFTNDGSFPDLLIRTSGKARLGQFLQWQCGFSIMCFPKVLWPDFTLWHFLLIIFRYQRQFKDIPNHQNKDIEDN
ncbi:hypothetical protein AMK59_3, partial [Oryctes borbonicus]